ncbi:isochorismate synthase DhbC [Micromonospora sonneratiae]|uniref:isochorismate synthase n=1 Tax=Micromonospora sonneratiae TaxID=1184706 RepID=A0ABW3YK35_9ACTN
MTTTSPQATASDLLSVYQPGASSLFASPRGTLLAEGTYFAVPPSARPRGLGDLAERVQAVFGVADAAGHQARMVVGAVPFDPAAPAHLVVPQRVRRSGPLPAPTSAPDTRQGPACAVTAEPDARDYAEAVGRAVSRIRAGEYTKVVLARSLRLTPAGPLDLPYLLRALARRDPNGYTFAMDVGDGRTLVGASPELLVSRTGRRVVANPIAGSAARHPDPAEDARRGAALLASVKDRHEHAVVVDAVAAGLRPLCARLDVPAEPSLVRTAAMWHLSTTVTAEVSDPAVSALALACALHPTPAVCGAPTDDARAAIAELEAFDRGFYTGLVGWGDADGDGEWVVTLRCGLVDGDSLRLYAGAGVVADSSPEAELAETTAKFTTFLTAMGLTDVA